MIARISGIQSKIAFLRTAKPGGNRSGKRYRMPLPELGAIGRMQVASQRRPRSPEPCAG
jgi:hypothetical protein